MREIVAAIDGYLRRRGIAELGKLGVLAMEYLEGLYVTECEFG